MKKILTLFCILLAGKGIAQSTLVNSGGAKIVIASGTDFKANNMRNDGTGSQITNDGDLYLKGNFNQTNSATYTGGASSWLWFEGTTTQNIQGDATLNIARMKVDNANGVQLAQNLSVANNLDIINGDLDLNGRNVDLGTTGILNEDRANNHLVLDNSSSLNETNKGGYVRISNHATTGTLSELAGLGIHLANAGTVSIDRYHYKGTSVGSGGIKKVYEITGTPTNATMRLEFASDELAGLTASTQLKLFRYNGSAWQNQNGTWTDATVDYIEATNINAFSPWTVGSSSPLPITLLGVKGKRVEGLRGEMTEEVKLTWTTAQEINNKGFEVETSENGLAYQKIAFVEGANNSTATTHYTLHTINPNDAYYRLKQVDFDGKFSYSPVVFIEGIDALKVYPNPNNGAFTISVGKDKLDLPARLLNAQGQEVWHGMQTEVRTTNLPNGVYFLHTTIAGKARVRKIIVEK